MKRNGERKDEGGGRRRKGENKTKRKGEQREDGR